MYLAITIDHYRFTSRLEIPQVSLLSCCLQLSHTGHISRHLLPGAITNTDKSISISEKILTFPTHPWDTVIKNTKLRERWCAADTD